MTSNRKLLFAILAILILASMPAGCGRSADRQWEELKTEYLKLCYEKRYDEALPLIQQALELATKAHGIDSRFVAYTKQDMGKLMFEMGRQPEAESLYLNAIAILEREPDRRTNLSYAACLRNLGQLYMSQQRFDEAQVALEKCLAIEVNAPRKEQFVTSMVLAQLGDVYWSRGLVTKALESYLQARIVGEQVWIGADLNRPLRMSDISYCWAIQGKSNAAAALADSAYQLTMKSTGLENPVAAAMMRCLAYCRQKQRNFEEAQRLNSAALDVFRKPGSPGQPGLATCYRDLADCSRELGNLTQSDSFCVAASEEACRLAPSDSLLKGLLEVTLANLRAAQGQTSVAESLYLHSIELFRGKLKNESWYLVDAYQGLGDLYLKLKRATDARTCYQKAIAASEVSLGQDAPRVGHLLEKYAEILDSLKMTKEAEEARVRAQRILASSTM